MSDEPVLLSREQWEWCMEFRKRAEAAEAKVEEVRKLVKKWREAEGKITQFADPSAYDGDSCADELEDALNKEKSNEQTL